MDTDALTSQHETDHSALTQNAIIGQIQYNTCKTYC